MAAVPDGDPDSGKSPRFAFVLAMGIQARAGAPLTGSHSVCTPEITPCISLPEGTLSANRIGRWASAM